jgi:hypothetical protein
MVIVFVFKQRTSAIQSGMANGVLGAFSYCFAGNYICPWPSKTKR